MYGAGYYRMDSSAARPFYGYHVPHGGYGPNRGPLYGGGSSGGWGGAGSQASPPGAFPGPAAAPSASPAPPVAGVFAGHGHPHMQQRGPKMGMPVSQLNRVGSMSMRRGMGGGPLERQMSLLGSNMGSAFGSFRGPMGGGGGAFGSGVSNIDTQPQLPRVSSGVGFGYSYGSFIQGAPGGGAVGNSSLMDCAGGGGGLQRNNSMPSYGFGSFANGLPGMGPGTSLGSLDTRGGSEMSNPFDAFTGGMDGNGSVGVENIYHPQRQDSQNPLQRQLSIAGQFYNFGESSGVRPGMMLNGRNAGVISSNVAGGAPFAFSQQQMQQQMMQQQMMQQRRLGNGGATRPPGQEVEEGAPTALGRKNSVSNMLERKDSQKRVGMYFKNKEATQEDVEYKKDGDPGTTKTASSKSRDPSLVNNVKPILLFDASQDGRDGNGVMNEVEIEGKTVRAEKPGCDEVQKYDMREVIFVNTREDVAVAGDSLDEIRDQFCNGANVGMLMADAECKAADPTSWFTWTALKTVVKNVFAKVDGVRSATASSSYKPKFEMTVSVCVLQDDQMLDLLGDDSNFETDEYHLDNLVVAESPLFGNVPNNAVFVVVEDADEFNDTLDACLDRARGFFEYGNEVASNHKNLDDVEEYGIVLATVVLKQTRKSTTSGKFDVVVSSIFASGVGDGVIHYNRIMDKNPAEPRALFYSVLHRSCHSTAVFSLKQNNPDIFTALTTLQRFSKVELRKPKVGSARQFLYYSENTMPKIKEDLSNMKEGRQKIQTQRFMERLQLMTQDMEQMLEDPEGCVPKTYI